MGRKRLTVQEREKLFGVTRDPSLPGEVDDATGKTVAWSTKLESRGVAYWTKFLDPGDAVKQVSFDRRRAVLRARGAGATLKAIADSSGLTIERIRQMETRAKMDAQAGIRSPIEMYLSEIQT